jgi:hypothetical protein
VNSPDPTANGQPSQQLDFDTEDSLTPIEVPVKYKGEHYVLKEATEEESRRYRNMRLRNIKYGPGGEITSLEGMADLSSFLVSLCLWKLTADGQRKPVSVAIIRQWPARIVDKLAERAKEISWLDESRESDPDPELISVCRRRFANEEGHSDDFHRGVDAALDFLKQAVKKKPVAETVKNSPSATVDISP